MRVFIRVNVAIVIDRTIIIKACTQCLYTDTVRIVSDNKHKRKLGVVGLRDESISTVLTAGIVTAGGTGVRTAGVLTCCCWRPKERFMVVLLSYCSLKEHRGSDDEVGKSKWALGRAPAHFHAWNNRATWGVQLFSTLGDRLLLADSVVLKLTQQ